MNNTKSQRLDNGTKGLVWDLTKAAAVAVLGLWTMQRAGKAFRA